MSFYANQCIKCKGISMKGDNNISKQIEVRKKISNKRKGIKRPDLVIRNIVNNPAKTEKHRLIMTGDKNPAKQLEVREKLKLNHATTNTLTKHHIYLKENSKETLATTYRKHQMLHLRAYEYLVKIGKILDYIKWFDKKYGLN